MHIGPKVIQCLVKRLICLVIKFTLFYLEFVSLEKKKGKTPVSFSNGENKVRMW